MAATAPVVVVTGAGRGLGLATARRVGADGHRVVLAELDP
ncbi:short-chain dehydrogenase, partial [Streptomyces albidoflavus]